MKKGIRIGSLLFAVILSLTAVANADEVTDWNQIMIDALRVSGLPFGGPLRAAAIVQASVFDALNGIEQRYTPIHVQPAPAPGASRRAAVVQAAYASLLGVLTNLTPAQMSDLNAKYAASLSAIASGQAAKRANRSLAVSNGDKRSPMPFCSGAAPTASLRRHHPISE